LTVRPAEAAAVGGLKQAQPRTHFSKGRTSGKREFVTGLKRFIGVRVVMACFATGCGAVHTWYETPQKDRDVLNPGTHRDRVGAELVGGDGQGALVTSEKN